MWMSSRWTRPANTGVDDIRELIESRALPPGASARYKVYIIDEVHMLSKNGLQRRS